MQKQIEELKRKSEQGSQQLQGEVQELQLEALLRGSFPHDTIAPVAKGEFGGDTVQQVSTPSGQQCGKILWESKRTRNWSDGWRQAARRPAHRQGGCGDPGLPGAAQASMFRPDRRRLDHHAEMRGGGGHGDPARAHRGGRGGQTGRDQQTKMEAMYHYLTGPASGIASRPSSTKSRRCRRTDRERKARRTWAKREQQIEGIASATSGCGAICRASPGARCPRSKGSISMARRLSKAPAPSCGS